MKTTVIDGIEIPYALREIERIDPAIVGHATLFRERGDSYVIAELRGNVREALIADYRTRPRDSFPEIVMYSGSKPG